ncbi:hypothetical protein OUHCRE2_24470 [Enterobacter asburiae]|nr:hypothetical protein TUM17556_21470 [Enterobacter asburiae]
MCTVRSVPGMVEPTGRLVETEIDVNDSSAGRLGDWQEAFACGIKSAAVARTKSKKNDFAICIMIGPVLISDTAPQH